MKPKLLIVLVLMVLVPLAVAAWLGVRAVEGESVVVENRLRELMDGQLQAIDAAIHGSYEAFEASALAELQPLPADAAEWRERARRSPFVEQYYMLADDGRLLYPAIDLPGELTNEERESLQRTMEIWDSGRVLERRPASAVSQAPAEPRITAPRRLSWFWGSGLRLLFWRGDGARLYAVEPNMTRLMAELVGDLPETDPLDPQLGEGRIQLRDGQGRPLYQWGAYEPGDSEVPHAVRDLAEPLGAWSLSYFAPDAALGHAAGTGYALQLGGTLLLVLAATGLLSYYFYREHARAMREASQRVTFVNQVSHELKTPLTNIRMYAELLAENSAAEDAPQRRHVDVIVSESQRLSRLIANVLTFSRAQREPLVVRRGSGSVDDVVQEVLEAFRPALAAKGITVETNLSAAGLVSLDADAVGQIAGNLISNVEKYAAAGGYLGVTTACEGDLVTLEVADRGSGLTKAQQRRVFEPFYRANDALTEGVSGTGIGLSIARDLARLHGGDLRAESSSAGSRFRATLVCPRVEEEG